MGDTLMTIPAICVHGLVSTCRARVVMGPQCIEEARDFLVRPTRFSRRPERLGKIVLGAGGRNCRAAALRCERGSASVQRIPGWIRSEEHTSELQSLMRISYAVFCLKKKQQDKVNMRNKKRNIHETQNQD